MIEPFLFRYGHRGEKTLPTIFFGHNSEEMDLGVSHHDEMFLLFGNDVLSDKDMKMSKKMVNLWTKVRSK